MRFSAVSAAIAVFVVAASVSDASNDGATTAGGANDRGAIFELHIAPPPPPFPTAIVASQGTATVDGSLAPGEWDSAGCLPLTLNIPHGGTTDATLCAMNDTANVYFSLRYDRPLRDPGNSFAIEFDNDNDGLMEEGDDLILRNPEAGFFDDYRTSLPPCASGDLCGPQDTDGGGTSDGAGTFQHHGTFSVYEMSHPLNSGDSHDFSLCGGQTVGFFIFVRMMAAGGVWPTDFADTTWPGWQQYVALTLAGACAPPTADVRVATSITPGSLTPGGTARITVTVTSDGPDAAPNVTADIASPSAELVAAGGATCSQLFGQTCSFGLLAAGASRTLVVDLGVPGSGLFAYTANVTHGALDPNQTNNAASAAAFIVPPSADVSVTLTMTPAAVAPGGTTTSTVTVTNHGPQAAANVFVEYVPTPQHIIKNVGGIVCPVQSEFIGCSLGTLAAGASVTFTITGAAEFRNDIAGGTATVVPAASDPNAANNTATAFVPVLLESFSGSGTSVIDGSVAAGEWSGAACRTFNAPVASGGTVPATLCAMNDLSNVYFSLRLDQTVVNPITWFALSFDADRDGEIESGDDWLVLPAASSFQDAHFENCPGGGICSRGDLIQNGAAAFQHHGTYSIFELSHPLASGDANDIALCPGQQIAFYANVTLGNTNGVTPIWPNPPFSADLALTGECVSATVPASTTVTTGAEATPEDIVETEVTSPVAGTVTIKEASNGGTPPSGYSFLGHAVHISAPPAPAGQYLTLVFRIDASVIPAGTIPAAIQVRRNGVAVAPCAATANPLPCVTGQFIASGDVELTVYTAQASVWDFSVRDRDVTPPTLIVSLSPGVLWPADHQFVAITATIRTRDDSGEKPQMTLVSIVSNEPENGRRDGDTKRDVQEARIGTDDRVFLLRAERAADGHGRVYTVTYRARDGAGNETTASAVVTVPLHLKE